MSAAASARRVTKAARAPASTAVGVGVGVGVGVEVGVEIEVGVGHRALRERAVARSSSFSAPPGEVSASPPVTWLAPNVVSVRHWGRLLGGALYASTPRVDWATLLRRTFSVDVLECAACHGRMRVLGSVTERDTVRAILERLAMAADAPCVVRARAPTDDEAIEEADAG